VLAPPELIRRAIDAQPWRGGLEPSGDYEPYQLDKDRIKGTIPSDLKVSVVRVGPARIRIGSAKYAHWFDGDGQVTRVTLDGASQSVNVATKMVRTKRVEQQEAAPAEEATNSIVPRGAWTQSSRGMRENLFKIPTNPSNTSGVFWAGKLLALCEGGFPMEVDFATLRTKGEVDFGLKKLGAMAFSAHYKVDPKTQEMYNFGLAAPPAAALKLFCLSPGGAVIRSGELPLTPGQQQLVHDWAMSDKFLVFCIDPWSVTDAGSLIAALAGTASFGGSFQWDASAKTRVVVIRKSDLSVACDFETDPFSTYHFSNAYDATGPDGGDRVHVHVCKHIGGRAQIERNFSDMYGAQWKRDNYNELCEMIIDTSRGGRLLSFEPVSDSALPMEFPKVATPMQGQRARYAYTSAFSDRPGANFIDCMQKIDLHNGQVEVRYSEANRFPSEVEFVSKSSGDPEDGYLVYLEYNSNTHTSDVIVLDAKDFLGEPLCTLQLPHHVPYTFHGCVVNR